MTISLSQNTLSLFLRNTLYALVAYDEDGYPVDDETWEDELEEEDEENDDEEDELNLEEEDAFE